MARTSTLTELRTRVQQRADVENDTHIGNTDLDYAINDAIAYVHDLKIEHAPSDYDVTEISFVTNGTRDHVLATIFPAGNFYKLRALYVNEGNNEYRAIHPVPEHMVQVFQVPASGVNMIGRYIPWATKLVNGSDTYDGINGWEELVVIMAAIDIKTKREEDVSNLVRKKMEFIERVQKMTNRDAYQPERVVRRINRPYPYYDLYRNSVNGYRIAGNNLQLYQLAPWISR